MGGRYRIGTVTRLLLLASAASGAPYAYAGDLSVTGERTTVIQTNNADGNGPGNVVIQPGATLSVTAPAVVTVNSSNTLTNSGTVTNQQTTNAVGVLITTTQNGVANNITGRFLNNNGVNVLGPQDNDVLTTPDGFNTGLRLEGLGTFTGDIINESTTGGTTENPTVTSGAILVGGNGSFGMRLGADIIGSVINKGSIIIDGDTSYGIAATNNISGVFTQGGVMTVSGADSVGVYLGSGVGGPAVFNGSVTAGTTAQQTSTNGVTVINIPAKPAKAGVWIASNIDGGMLLTGNRLTRAEETANPTAANAATPADASIAVVGATPLLITQGGLNPTLRNIVIGAGQDSFSIKNQGNILGDGTVKGLSATAIDIHGMAVGSQIFTTHLPGGIWNDRGNIEIAAQDATAIGVNIGAYGLVSRIQNDGEFLVNSVDSTTNALTGAAGTKGGPAYGVLVDSAAKLDAFGNSGRFFVSAQGPTTNAYGVLDLSGSLTNIVNFGFMNIAVQPGSIGKAIAIDVSRNTSGVTVHNTGTIVGDVLLGAGRSSVALVGTDASIVGNVTFQNGAAKSGTSTLTMDGGLVTGVVNLGNGTHTVTLRNGAKATGGIGQGTGTVALSVDASNMTILSSQPLTASTANFTGASTLTFNIDNSAATQTGGILRSTGAVNFASTSRVTAAITGLIEGTKVIPVIRANSLVLGAPLSTLASSPNSYINATSFSVSPTDPNTLLLTVSRKSAAQLGLGQNMTAIYDGFTTALNSDVPLVTAVSGLQTQSEFESSLRKLMPDSSGALQQAALNNQEMAAGAIRRRLVGVAKNGMPDHAAGDIPSFWAQAIGDYSDQSAHGEQNGFDIWGLGIAFGADTPIFDNSTNVGIAFTETWHSANLKVSARSPVEFYNTQLNFYSRYTGNDFYLQTFAGGGYNSYNQERSVVIGSVSRLAIGKWKGYEYGGTIEGGFFTRIGNTEVTPFLRASYLKNHENGYTETSGGAGIDLSVAPRNAQIGRGSAGLTIDRDFPVFYDSYIEAEFRANYTRDFMNDPYAVRARFATGPEFVNFSSPRSPNRANVGIGFAHKDSYSSVSIDYDAEYAKGYLAHKAAITARFRF